MVDFRLSSGLTAEAIEDLARDLEEAADELHLILRGAGSARIGADARLVGVLAKLRRDGVPVRAHLHTGDNQKGLRADSRYRDLFADELLGMVLGAYCNTIVKQDGEDITGELAGPQRAELRNRSGIFWGGNRLSWVIRDELPLIRPDLLDNMAEGDRSTFAENLFHRIERSWNMSLTLGRESPSRAAFAAYLWEVLKNTEVHAGTVDGRPTGGIRFIEAKRYQSRQLDTQQLSGAGQGQLASYLDSVTRRFHHPVLIEITVVDPGPGIAATMAGSMSVFSEPLSDEIQLTQSAFTREGTSRSTYDPDAGLGLDEALSACESVHGFMTVRTGRLELTRHFLPGSEPGRGLKVRTDRKLALLAGTAITLLFPAPANARGNSSPQRRRERD